MKLYLANHWMLIFRASLILFLFSAVLFPGRTQMQPAQAETAAGCPAGRVCVYLPFLNGPAFGDLEISGIEVTQAIQDPQNNVPLVEGRNTLLRLYARALDVEKPVANVKINIAASISSQALSGSPSAFTTTIPLTYDPSDLQTTLNIVLPPEWTHGTVDLTVRVDPGNEIGEKDETNNTISHRLVFHPVPPLEIKIVPVRYENPNDGRVYPAPTTDTISDWIRRAYPVAEVDISFHDPITFSGNLSSYQGFYDLLNQVTSLKSTENSDESVVYYGLVPVSNSSSTWFYGGIAGIGWVGARSSVGLDLPGGATQIAGHEIGHNLGLWHSPCGNVDPTTLEAGYPYSDGSIGQYGMNINQQNTSQTLIAPTAKDIMSYCSSRWISDYVYTKLFYAQSAVQKGSSLSQASEANAQQGLVVRAQITASGAELSPAYILPGLTGAPAAGDYEVEVFGPDNKAIIRVPVRAFTADANLAEQSTGINTIVPLPDLPAAGFRLLKDGKILAEQTLNSGGIFAPGLTGGDNRPALVRYSRDGGQTWATLGIDVVGGELLERAANPEPGVLYQVIPAGAAQ